MFTSDSVYNESFSLFHYNIRSIPSNLESLTDYLHVLKFNFSVIALTETWLTNENCSLYGICNYNSHHSVRENRRGGGVSIFVNPLISFKTRPDLEKCDDNIECAFIQILQNPLNSTCNPLIGAVYRPPNSNAVQFNDSLNELLNKVKSEQKTCYIMGDFNFNLVKPDSHATNFLDLMHTFSFRPLIDRPTRITSSSKTLIDNVFTNDLTSDVKSGILYTCISDHLPNFVLVPSNGASTLNKTYTTIDYSDANKARFSQSLINENWSELYQCNDAEAAFDIFISKFASFYSQAFPTVTKTIKTKRCKPWVTTAIKKSIKVKNKLYVVFHKQPTVIKEIRYKSYKYQLEKILKQSKKLHYETLLENSKNNLRKTWGILRELIGNQRNEQGIAKVTHNGSSIVDKKKIADHLNTHFTSIGKKLTEQIPHCNTNPLHYLDGNFVNSFFLTPVQPNDVNNCIFHLKATSAPGHDQFSPLIIKENKDCIVHPLTYVINLSLRQGYIPPDWKRGHVTPIFKAGERDNMSNYRPISVLPVFSKILERIVYDKVFSYLNDLDVLSNKQFGFRRGHSTEMPLAIALNQITLALDQRQHSIGIFLDLQKAFDVVDHSILLKKLEYYGIRGVSLEWFRNYLSGRTQLVKLSNNVYSDPLPVLSGVPQGSILGPLLFLLFINDLCNLPLSLKPLLFADDTTLLYSHTDVDVLISTINHDLQTLSMWFKANKLLLNVNKTHFMFFSLNTLLHKSELKIEIDNCALNRVFQTKFLGVIIDCKLTWSDHVSLIASKVSKSIGIINKVKYIVNQDTLRQLYNTLILPYYMYCHVIWAKCSQTNLNRLVLLQKKIVRIVTKAHFRAHTDPIFFQLKILKVQNLFTYLGSIFIFKLLHGIFPPSLSSVINIRRVDHTISTRSNRKSFSVPYCRTSLRQRSLLYQIPKLCNSFYLPNDLDDSTSIYVLKRKLKIILLQN